jgi:hypothetical protein
MMRGLRQLCMFSAFLLMMAGAPGLEAATPKVIYARTAVGEIHSIDLVKRTAIIGGYRYYFGDPRHSDSSRVSLYGYHSGSFEMLSPGMKVYIRYAEYGVGRYVVSLKQLAPGTDVHARGVKVDP